MGLHIADAHSVGHQWLARVDALSHDSLDAHSVGHQWLARIDALSDGSLHPTWGILLETAAADAGAAAAAHDQDWTANG